MLGFEKIKISYGDNLNKFEVNIDDIIDGVSQNEDFIFFRNNDRVLIYDRVCDHNNGRLSVKGETAFCPLHNWELDVKNGKYLNANCSKLPLASINENELDSPYISIEKVSKRFIKQNFDLEKNVEITFLNHACLHFNIDNKIKFATDPWVIGPAFCNGWWLKHKSPENVFDILNDCDFIYISHNHPDHLHYESLKKVRKNMPIITADFNSDSTKSLLKQYGFVNIEAMDFTSKLINVDEQISLAVLKSGDFRDDSGLLLEIGSFSCLLTVDSNFLNFGKLPKVDMLCSSFAGGASGFPLCFDNYSEREKKIVVLRNKGAIMATNFNNIDLCKPKYFMPYAGFFTEDASRDQYIKENNVKNSIQDYRIRCEDKYVKLLDVEKCQVFTFMGNKLINERVSLSNRYEELPQSFYLEKFNNISKEKFENLVYTYFKNSNFKDNLILDLSSTNDDFSKVFERFIINFSKEITVNSLSENELEDKVYCENKTHRYLQIKVRRGELYNLMKHGKPWEDLSIGFQCRIYREPNIYNSDFWFYFTNVYIGEKSNQYNIL